MTRRANEGEGVIDLIGDDRIDRSHGRARGQLGRIERTRVGVRFVIKMAATARNDALDLRDEFGRMHRFDLFIRCGNWIERGETGQDASLFQHAYNLTQPLRRFRMSTLFVLEENGRVKIGGSHFDLLRLRTRHTAPTGYPIIFAISPATRMIGTQAIARNLSMSENALSIGIKRLYGV